MKNLTIKKEIIIALIMALVFSMMPMFSINTYAASKPKKPKYTKIVSAKVVDNGEYVKVKWKKVKCSGYKVYKKNAEYSCKAQCVKTIKKSSTISFKDKITDDDGSAVYYYVKTYKNYKSKGKTKKVYSVKSVSKEVSLYNTAAVDFDPATDVVTENIYNKLSTVKATKLDIETVRALMIYAVNKEREKNGSVPLELSDILNETAQQKSAEMAKLNIYAHKLPTIGDFFTQLQQIGFTSQGFCGENIYKSPMSVSTAMKGWMNSPGHKSNILGKPYNYIGIGFYYDGENTYWTQQFTERLR